MPSISWRFFLFAGISQFCLRAGSPARNAVPALSVCRNPVAGAWLRRWGEFGLKRAAQRVCSAHASESKWIACLDTRGAGAHTNDQMNPHPPVISAVAVARERARAEPGSAASDASVADPG